MSAYIVQGKDASLVSRELTRLLDQIAGTDGGAEVETYEAGSGGGDTDSGASADGTDGGDGGGSGKGRLDIGPVLSALATPSWLSEHRIVVVRDAGTLTAAQAGELATAVAQPATDNVLVLVSVGRAVPTALSKAVKAAGGTVVDTDPGRASAQRQKWFTDHVDRTPVSLDASARKLLMEHIGEDAARLDPILDLLSATHGAGRRLSAADVEPWLGESGGSPPWELTDAIDKGDGEAALVVLHRLLGPGELHPLQVIGILRRHVSGLLRLDGADDVRSADDAAAALQMSAFPARKLLEQSRKLGHERIVRAVEVVANADADLRGRMEWPDALVMEVAVARLAQLCRSTAAPGRPARSGRPA